MRVWVTRAAPGAQETAALLEALGHTALIGPLLATRLVDPGLNAPPSETAALAFTSANAVRAFAAWSPRRDWPVFTVGDATAAAAREAGFGEVSSADGDVDALARLIVSRPPQGVILHPRARETAGDLAALLAAHGLPVAPVVLYETIACVPPASVAQAWGAGEIEAVLLHSPKAARVLADWLADRASPAKPAARALGLSPACLAPLSVACFADRQAAIAPNEAALLALLV